MDADQIAAIEQAMAEEHRKDLEALKRLKRFLNNGSGELSLHGRLQAAKNAGAQTLVLSSAPHVNIAAGATIIGTVKNLLASDPAQGWTVPETLDYLRTIEFPLKSKKPEATLGLTFATLVERGEIRIYRRGSGRIPHIYKAVVREEDSSNSK